MNLFIESVIDAFIIRYSDDDKTNIIDSVNLIDKESGADMSDIEELH